MKTCYFCKKPAPETFDPKSVFDGWASNNKIISPYRSRFDGIYSRLKWAALDETDLGCHPECALSWSVKEEFFMNCYPIITTAQQHMQLAGLPDHKPDEPQGTLGN